MVSSELHGFHEEWRRIETLFHELKTRGVYALDVVRMGLAIEGVKAALNEAKGEQAEKRTSGHVFKLNDHIAALDRQVEQVKHQHPDESEEIHNLLDHVEFVTGEFGVDSTTLTGLGLNVDRRQSMGKGLRGRRRGEGGMPLERMGFRQRLRSLGAY
ncbi:hypothetical protein JCM11251_000882 [Rhodosporidiobolus azoricus]